MKIFLLILFSFIALVSCAQPVVQRTNGQTTPNDPRLMASKNLYVPIYNDTTQANLVGNIGIDSCGAIIFTYVGNGIWKRNCSPKRWDLIGRGTVSSVATNTGTGIIGGPITTTGTLAADTANVLSTKAYRQKGIDSLILVINGRNYISNINGLITAGANVTVTGAGTVGNPYVINSTGGGGGSVLISAGYGIINTPDPIISAGTVKVDTTNAITSLASRRKLADSLGSIIATKVNITDTANMLAPYINSVGYGLTKTGQNVKADTATLFSAVRATAVTPTWPQVLAAGRTFSANDSVIQGSNYLRFKNGIGYTGIAGAFTTVQPDSTIGNPYLKRILPISSWPNMLNWNESIQSSAQTSNSPNIIYMRGWNLAPGGQQQIANLPAIGQSTESNYRPDPVGSPALRLMEDHTFYITPQNKQIRLQSYTVRTDNNVIDFYHTTPTFHLQDTLNNQYFNAQTSGSDGTTTIQMLNSQSPNRGFSFIANGVSNDLYIDSQNDSTLLNFRKFKGFFFGSTQSYGTDNDIWSPMNVQQSIHIKRSFQPFGLYFDDGSTNIGAITTNNSTGEMRHYQPVGGYFQTFYGNGIEKLRITGTGIGINTGAPPSQALQVKGQVQIDTLTTGTLGTDSVVVAPGGLLKKIAQSDIAGAAQIITVIDIPTMQGYAGTAGYVYVQDSLIGGGFHLYTGPLSPDGSTIYSGVGGRKWQRDYNTQVLDFSITGTLAPTDSILTYASGAFKHSPATVLPFLASKNTFTDSLIATSGVRFTGLTAGVGTKAIRYNPANGQFTYADTTSGGSAYTFSTGLTNASSTITNNLSTGITGGQTLRGGIASSENLTITSTNHAVKGNTFFGTSLSVFNENTGRWGFGTTSPSAFVTIGGGAASAGSAPMKFTSGTPTTTPEVGAVQFNSGLWIADSSNSVRDTLATRSWARNNISGGAGTTYTFSTGLTNTANTITDNLATGVSGGQTAIGSTSTNSGLTLKATTNTGATGADIIGTSGTNGATEIFRGTNAGNFGIGTGSTVSSKLHVVKTSIGTTNAIANGLYLQNTTVAASGLQQNSPPVVWEGQGWKTTATAASQPVAWMADIIPVQGTTNPSSTWQLAASANGGAFSNLLTITDAGTGTLSGTFRATTALGAGTQVTAGTTTTSQAYRTTNGGSNVTPQVWAGNSTVTAGTLGVGLDNTNQLTFLAANGTRMISRAAIGIGNLTNTAGSETGDMLFYTQTGGSAIAETMRLTATGNLGTGGVTSPTAGVHTPASTTTRASLRIPTGTAPTSPNEGDVWQNSNNFLAFTNSTTYTIAKTLTNTATLDFPSTGASASSDLTITVTNAASGDLVIVTPPAGSVLANSIYTAWVSASNTITVRFSNLAVVGSADPASGTFRASILKY